MKTRAWLLSCFLFFAVVPVVGPAPVACAAEGPHAALVIDTGEEGGRYSLCVALPREEVTGLELIELAGDQFDLSYRFGYGGNAVCELAGVGSESDDCFDRYPDFWGYWRGDGSGGWTWSSGGAGSSRVRDGDVEGWSWGSGADGRSHPPPPTTTFVSVCGYEPTAPDEGGYDEGGSKEEPREEREQRKKRKKRSPGSAGSAEGPGSQDASSPESVAPAAQSREQRSGRDHRKREEKREGRREKERMRSPRKALPSPSPTPIPSDAEALPASARAEDGGPPWVGLVGLVIAALLVALAAVFKRRPNTD